MHLYNVYIYCIYKQYYTNEFITKSILIFYYNYNVIVVQMYILYAVIVNYYYYINMTCVLVEGIVTG